MAEAHSAVAFSFSVTHEGLTVDYDVELLRNIWETFVRAYKRRAASFSNNFRTGIWPATPGTLVFTVCVICGLTMLRMNPLFGLIPYVRDNAMVAMFGEGMLSLLISGFVCSFLVWFVVIQLIRYLIKTMLLYKGWFYAGRKAGAIDKIYFIVMNFITRFDPMLHSFQGALPKLPLPSLRDTLDRHLKSVKPILNSEDYAKVVQLTDEFKEGQGIRFQRWLMLKSWFTNNYVSDWWEDNVYLRGRGPIMVNSNYYGMDSIFLQQTTIQAARAANFIYAALLFRRSIERQELKPILLMKTIPLCSSQYERMFNTCRIPGRQQDIIKHWDDSRHVAVYHRGCWYKMPIHDGKALYQPAYLEAMIQWILNQDPKPSFGEAHLAALTAGERTPWAIAREKHFSTGDNKKSLDLIEKSAFTLILDDVEIGYDPDNADKLDEYAHCMLHGRCYDRWFDKSFNLIVTKNAKVGLNGEHSWSDAPVMAHFSEVTALIQNNVLKADAPIMAHFTEASCITEQGILKYTDGGHTRGKIESKPPNPTRLVWNINAECNEAIETSLRTARALAQDVDMALLVFKHYGKGMIKKCKCSPDAFIQCALQMTYYQDQGSFSLTYEASMVRFFREGRTETVRSVTQASCDFVRAMFDHNCTDLDRVELMTLASETHTDLYKDAMCGKGVDRHLFALYVVSRYLEVDSPFLASVISEKWRLSTSQTPHQQTEGLDLSNHPDKISAGGGFGPVADDGYGISYIFGGEDIISFHISSKKSASNTESKRFRERLEKNLLKMRDIFHVTS